MTATAIIRNRIGLPIGTSSRSDEEFSFELIETCEIVPITPSILEWWEAIESDNTSSSVVSRMLSRIELANLFEELTKNFRDFTTEERKQIKVYRQKVYKISPLDF